MSSLIVDKGVKKYCDSDSESAPPPPPSQPPLSLNTEHNDPEHPSSSLSASTLLTLSQISPSFNTFNFDEIFDDTLLLFPSLPATPRSRSISTTSNSPQTPSHTSNDDNNNNNHMTRSQMFRNEESDDMERELNSLSRVEAQIRAEMDESYRSFEEERSRNENETSASDINIDNADLSLLDDNSMSSDSDSSEFSNPLPTPTLPLPSTSRQDVKAASNLLKGTEALKKQLQLIKDQSTYNQKTGLTTYHPPPHKPTPSPSRLINRCISDNNHLTLKLSETLDVGREYLEKLDSHSINNLFVGLNETPSETLTNASKTPSRILCLRLRPDVLCGSIMSSLSESIIQNHDFTLEKRQGSHVNLRCPWCEIDAQVLLKRGGGDVVERVLLIRAYSRVSDFDDFDGNDNDNGDVAEEVEEEDEVEESAISEIEERTKILTVSFDPPSQNNNNNNLKLTSQPPTITDPRIPVPAPVKIPKTKISASYARQVISSTLASVLPPPTSSLTLPDQTASKVWPVLSSIIEDLDSLDFLYASLGRCPFGIFPALGSIDTQFLSQIRALAHTNMRTNLMKSAKDLEEYARASELSCASLIDLLQPTFAKYKVREISLPVPLQLSVYPLDFKDGEVECPPFGKEVMEGLLEVGIMIRSANEREVALKNSKDDDDNDDDVDEDDEDDISFGQRNIALADSCVLLLRKAFNLLTDHEYVARIARKNMQVMDRLSKMSYHKEKMILELSNAKCPEAKRHAQSEDLAGEVPIYWCRVVAGSKQGKVYVTKSALTFVTTQALSLGLGGKHVSRILIQNVDAFKTAKPNAVKVKFYTSSDERREKLDSFTFTLLGCSAGRFVDLLESVQVVVSKLTIKFTDLGGLLYGNDDYIRTLETEEDFVDISIHATPER